MAGNRYAFFDVDKTLHDGALLSDFTYYLVEQGKIEEKVREDCMSEIDRYNQGRVDYHDMCLDIARICSYGFEGLAVEDVSRIARQFVDERVKLYPWVHPLMDYLGSHKWKMVLISGGYQFALAEFSRLLPDPSFYGTELQERGGEYTGKIKSEMFFENKAKLVTKLLKQTEGSVVSIGFGDSESDLAMLSLVDRAFVINPEAERMRQISKEKGYILTDDAETMIEEIDKLLQNRD